MRRIVCLVRGHRWQIQENRATGGTEQDCQRCGAHRSSFPGDPQYRPPGRQGDNTGEISGPGGFVGGDGGGGVGGVGG